jgi:hypothetical protein
VNVTHKSGVYVNFRCSVTSSHGEFVSFIFKGSSGN